MRTIALLALAVSPVLSEQREDKFTQADFVIGQVMRVTGGQTEVDLGYVNGFKRGHKFALFRKAAAWSPVGIVSLTKVGSFKSTVGVVRGVRPVLGDLVVVHQNTLGHQTGKMREDFYITRRILSRQYQNGYDTRGVATDSRQLARQLDNGRRWFRQKRRAEVKINFGARKAAYESESVRQLASQCQLLAEIQEGSPGGLKSLPDRWTWALPIVTGYKPPEIKIAKDDAESDDESDETDDEFAEQPVRNILPQVMQEFREESIEYRETVAIILGAAVANPPANRRFYLRAKFKQSQFPKISVQSDVIERLDDFLSTLN